MSKGTSERRSVTTGRGLLCGDCSRFSVNGNVSRLVRRGDDDWRTVNYKYGAPDGLRSPGSCWSRLSRAKIPLDVEMAHSSSDPHDHPLWIPSSMMCVFPQKFLPSCRVDEEASVATLADWSIAKAVSGDGRTFMVNHFGGFMQNWD